MVDKVSEFAKDLEERLLYYVSVAEQVAKELSSANVDLNSLVDDLRNEVEVIMHVLLRAFGNNHSTEYEKLLVKMDKMSQEVKKLLRNGMGFQVQADEPTPVKYAILRSIKGEQCTGFERSSFIQYIRLLMDEKQKAEESLTIEKERTLSQANELASLRSALNETECQKLLREEQVRTEKLMLLLEIEKERTHADELASIRSTFEETYLKYQKLIMDERKKVADLRGLLIIEQAITQSQANQLALRSATAEVLREPDHDAKKLLEGLEDAKLSGGYSLEDQLEYFDVAIERIKRSVGEKNGVF